MRRVRGLKRLFRFPWRTAAQIRDEVDAELEFHLAMRAEALEREGRRAADARREAIDEFGDVNAAKRALRGYGERAERQTRLRRLLDDFARDVRYAWRSLRHSPGFAAVVVIVLSLGIGVNAAAFNLVDLLLVRSVRIEDPERVFGIYSNNVERRNLWNEFSYPEYRAIREQTRTLANVEAFTMDMVGVGEGETAGRTFAGYVSAGFFGTLGVPLSLGRDFSVNEERSGGAAPVVVLSHRYWARNGRDPDILGSTLRVNGDLHEVIGVAAEGFTGTSALIAPNFWLPLGALERYGNSIANERPRSIEDAENRALLLFGRLRAESSSAELASDLEMLTARVAPEYGSRAGERYAYIGARLPRASVGGQPVRDELSMLPVAVLLMAMSGVVLLIACLNLANMFLARGASRGTELAIRQALGGGRVRLVRQLLTEALLLALAGCAVGLVLAYWGTSWLLASLSALLPSLGVTLALDVQAQAWVLVTTAAVSVAATLLFGLGPALRITGAALTASLKQHGGDVARGRGPIGFLLAPRSLLLTAQIALSLALLTAAGLFARGALATAQITPGFPLERGLIAELNAVLGGYDEPRSREVYAQVLARLRSLPQIEGAALASNVALGDMNNETFVQRAGAGADDGSIAHDFVIGDGYFETLGLPLLRGRGFTAGEAVSADGTPVAIVDEPLAEGLFGRTDVVGERLQVPTREPGVAPPVLEIVGVVPGVRQAVLDSGPSPHLYVPFGQRFEANVYVHARAAAGADAASLRSAIRQEIRAIDAGLPLLRLETLREHRDRGVFVWFIRAGGKVFAVMGVFALLLATVGVYGVRSFVMARRTREIGVRMALGATSGNVVRQMVRESAALTFVGLALGLTLAIGVGYALQSLLFEVSAFDPFVLATATAVLTAAATLATYLPARRASRIDPLAALRQD